MSSIGPLIEPRRRITLDHLAGQVVAIDAMNALYQFLAIIRLRDGAPLRDRHGMVTSHLQGLFYRTINLLEHGIRPVYVFDGKPPALKQRELEKRRETKEKFEREWREALARGDLVAAFKKAVMTARLTTPMIEEARKLLNYMGVPCIQAPSEGEAQLAYMVQKKQVDAAGSQDYDSLLFGCPRLILNLTIAGKKYFPKRGIAVPLVPEEVLLNRVLQQLGVSREQLIEIAMLVGTDYNEGIKGVGPKRALQLIKRFGTVERVANYLGVRLDFDPEEVRRIYLQPAVTDDYHIGWKEPQYDRIYELLVEQHDFSADRVRRGLQRLHQAWIRLSTRVRRLPLDG